MAKSLAAFKHNMSTSTKKDVQDTYKMMVRSTADNSALKSSKLSWMLEEYPLLAQGDSPTTEVPVITAEVVTPQNKPYEVKLAEKYHNLYKSAARRGKAFNLTLKDVHKLLQATRCYFTEVNFIDGDAQYKRTIDRVDHTKGYVKGNVVACTLLANQLKASLFERPTSELGDNINFMYKVAAKVLERTNGKD